jgi:hypothetical protein
MAFDGTLKFDTAIDQSGFLSGVKGLGGIAASGMNAVTGAFMGAAAAGTAAVAAIGKQALDAYADFEQLAGGVETLFGDAADVVMQNAAQAFKTAGMSANEYMETATASAAAMVASLAGDTQKAAELTDMAVMDMSDNANKMGTAMENIQNAYAGFAKGNFTMLDNLKLGYGGTKTEMERLLVTAQELTGIQYDISNYADIVQAIHAIQEQMGVTGTTAREASETISGSTAAVKAAWDNLLVGIADDSQDFDKLAQDFVTSVETAAGNILPRIETIGGGVVKLIGALGDDAVRLLTDALSYAPELASIGVQLIEALLEGLTDHLPELLDSGKTMLLTLANGAVNSSWVVLDAVNAVTAGLADAVADEKLMKRLERTGRTLLANLARGLETNLPVLLETGTELLQWLLDAFLTPENLAEALAFGGKLLSMLVDSLIESQPILVEGADTLIKALVGALADPATLTALLGAGLMILETLMQVIGDNIGMLIGAAIQIVQTLGEFLVEHAPELITCALDLVLAIVDGILENIDTLLDASVAIITKLAETLTDPEKMQPLMEAAGRIITKIFEVLCETSTLSDEGAQFMEKLFSSLGESLSKVDWAALGKSILDGIFTGLLGVDFDFYDYLGSFGDNWLSGIKDVFGIHSPSKIMRDQVGRNLALGVGEGFTEEMPDVGQEALTAFRGMEREVLPDPGEMRFTLTPEIDTGAFDAMREVRTEIDASALDALRVIVPEMAASRYIEPPAATYITNYDTSYITNSENHAAPEPAAPGGDIIIPVSIGGQQLDTIVIKAAQIANARSGGVTI